MNTALLALGAAAGPILALPFVSRLPRDDAMWLSAATAALSVALIGASAIGFVLHPSASTVWLGAAAFQVDGLATTVGPAIAVVGLALILAAPRRALDGRFLIGVLGMTSSGLGALLAGNLAALVAFEVSGIVTLWLVLRDRRGGRLALWTLGGCGIVWLTAAAWDPAAAAAPWGSPAASSQLPPPLLAALLLSVLGRLGIVPLNSWATAATESARPLHVLPALLPLGGVALAARWLHPQLALMLPANLQLQLSSSILALALVTVGVALVQQEALRSLAFILGAVQALVLVAVLDPQPLGHLGGELLWAASLVAGAGFTLSVMGARARLGALDLRQFHGLERGAPRLALSCLLFGLALAGLPGSVDFVAQELLLNAGIAQSTIGIGVAATVAAGLGFATLRLFFHIYYGPGESLPELELTTREMVALVPLATLLLLGGLAPGLLPLLRGAQAVHGG